MSDWTFNALQFSAWLYCLLRWLRCIESQVDADWIVWCM